MFPHITQRLGRKFNKALKTPNFLLALHRKECRDDEGTLSVPTLMDKEGITLFLGIW